MGDGSVIYSGTAVSGRWASDTEGLQSVGDGSVIHSGTAVSG